jgi:hypothetical protein
MVKEVSFMKFCDTEEARRMTTSQAWEAYLIKVKGKIQKELEDYEVKL